MKLTHMVELYSDGSAQPNPGPAGYAYLIRYWEMPDGDEMPNEKVIEASQGYRLSSNNRMEILGCVKGMDRIIDSIRSGEFDGCTQLTVYSDSEYLVRAITNRWVENWEKNGWMTSGYGNKKSGPVKNKDLWLQLQSSISELKKLNMVITFIHVKGHEGQTQNERCDEMAKAAAAGLNQIIDEEYERLLNNNRRY